jgi:hypothetical protein
VMRSQAVTAINAAKTECIHGHPFAGCNVYWRPGTPGHRDCRACARDRRQQRQRRQQALVQLDRAWDALASLGQAA